MAALAALPDGTINTSDAPDVTDWPGATSCVFYRVNKQLASLRLDAGPIAWLKDSGEGHQTRITAALRPYVQRQGARWLLHRRRPPHPYRLLIRFWRRLAG